MPGTNRAAAFLLQNEKTNPSRRLQTNLSGKRTQQVVENTSGAAGNEPIRSRLHAKGPDKTQKYFSTKRTQFPGIKITSAERPNFMLQLDLI